VVKVSSISADVYVVAPRKATEEFIKAARGVGIPGTEEEVDPSCLDPEGLYIPKQPENS